MFEKITDKKVRVVIENTVEESQNGFRRGTNMQDHIFIIKQMKQKVFQEKKKIFLTFIDLKTKLLTKYEGKGVEDIQGRMSVEKLYK